MKRQILLLLLIITINQITFSQEIKTEKYCKKIEVELDKFNGETKYSTPLLNQISFTKIIRKGETVVYMRIRTIGLTPSTGEGVIILLDNGEKITKNVKTSVTVNSDAQYEHSAFLSLTKDEIELIKAHEITNVRLYIFDIGIVKPIQYRAYMMCLDEKQ